MKFAHIKYDKINKEFSAFINQKNKRKGYVMEKSLLFKWIEENKEEFYSISDNIWENPELSMQEYFASEQIAKVLKKYDFQVEKGVAGMPTALVATWGEGKPTIGFSSEYDALPGLSQKKDANRQSPVTPMAPGHGCGHNLLSVGGVIAAIALKTLAVKEGICLTIKVFGTPAEELCIGKPYMAREGLFEGVDTFLDWHPSHLNRGGCCATNGYFNVKYHFKGKSSHGNAPWQGRSALDAGMLMGMSLEMLREHIPPSSPDAPTTLNYAYPDMGNSFPNVIPDKSVVWCIGRVKDGDVAAEVMSRIEDCAKGCALATGTEVESNVITASHDLIPNMNLSKLLEENLTLVGVPQFTEEEQMEAKEIQRSLGVKESGYKCVISDVEEGYQPVTDSSEYSWFAPIGFLNVALCPSIDTALHSWAATSLAGREIGKKALLVASKTLAATALDLILNPQNIEEAKLEWKERMGDRSFKTLLPTNSMPDLETNKEIMERFK